MSIFYKLFNPLRTALCGLIFLLFLGIFAPPANAESYVVEGVQVDVSANNAIAARDQAFAEAQRKAFKTLAAQFMAADQAAAFQPPDAMAISPMIRDFEVTQEKLSSTRYIGAYTFRFKESAVQQFFASRSGPAEPIRPSGMTQALAPPGEWTDAPESSGAALINSNASRQTYLVLPFYQQGRQSLLWSPYNGWMQAWRRATPPNSQVLPIGDLTDVGDIGDGEALAYDQDSLLNMLVRYSAREAVMVVATPDGEFSRAPSDAAPVSGTLRIAIFRTDRRDGPEQAGEIAVTASSGDTRGRVFDRAVQLVQRTLGTEWKNNAYVPPSSAVMGNSAIELRVPFDNLQQWAAAQRVLNRIQGVNDIVLKSLAPREARIGLVYNGGADALRIALQQAGMTMSEGAEGLYDLYIGGSAPARAYMPMQQAPGLQTAPRPAPRYNGEQPYINTF